MLADEFDEYERVSHPSTAMKSWKSFYDNQEMVDVTVVVGSNKMEIKAHKLVLCAHSDVLKKMLTSPMKEAQDNTIEFPQVDETAFRALLEFFYTGNVPVNKSFICQLIELCDYVHVPNLKTHCCTWLHENLVAEDACEYLMFSKKPSADEQLYENCFQWIEDHAAEVLNTDGFEMYMTAEDVKRLAASDDLNLDEIQLFQGIEQWIEYDDSRHGDGTEIAKLLRLPMMNVSDLLGCVKSSTFVESNAILEALMLLQQPTVYNPREIVSSNFNDLRLPSERISRFRSSFTWKLPGSTTSVRGLATTSFEVLGSLPTNSNRIVVKSLDVLHTAAGLPIPSCARVQLTTKSTVNRKVTVGLLILPSDRDSFQSVSLPGFACHGRLGSTPPQRCGVQIENATLYTFPLFKAVSIPAGRIVALKFHVTLKQVCIHLNGAVIAQIPLTTESCCNYLPQFGQSCKIAQQSSSQQAILDRKNDKKNVYIEVAIENIENTATVSVKSDTASC